MELPLKGGMKHSALRKPPLEAVLHTGHYARKQVFSRSAVLAWSHRSRFELGRRLVQQYAGKRLLDYGCGDGTFLAIVSDLFPGAVGTDADIGQLEDCRRRLTDVTSISFKTINELSDSRYKSFFDVVTCMEVLEHCVEAETAKLLENLRWLCAESGMILISVPIEIGPTLIVKQFIRMIAGWRSFADDFKYRERYKAKDFLRMVFAHAGTKMHRPVYSYSKGFDFHGHFGFNWRALQIQVSRILRIVEVRFSPLGWSRGFMSSQAWFICRPSHQQVIH